MTEQEMSTAERRRWSVLGRRRGDSPARAPILSNTGRAGRAYSEQELQELRDALQAYTDHDSMFYVQPLLGAKHAREALARSSRKTP